MTCKRAFPAVVINGFTHRFGCGPLLLFFAFFLLLAPFLPFITTDAYKPYQFFFEVLDPHVFVSVSVFFWGGSPLKVPTFPTDEESTGRQLFIKNTCTFLVSSGRAISGHDQHDFGHDQSKKVGAMHQ